MAVCMAAVLIKTAVDSQKTFLLWDVIVVVRLKKMLYQYENKSKQILDPCLIQA